MKGEKLMNQEINIEINIPTNITRILSDINDQIKEITSSTNNLLDNFNLIGTTASSIYSIKKAFQILKGPVNALGIALATKIPFITAIVNSFQFANVQLALFNKQTKIATASVATLTANLTAKQIAVGILTKQIGFLVGAKALLKKAMLALAGPIGWIIAGVGVLVAGIIGLVRWLNRGTDAGAEFAAENERSAEAMDNLNNSIESNRRAHDNYRRSVQVSHRVNQDLMDSLVGLRNGHVLTSQQRHEVRNQVNQLNSSMEGLNLVIDEETGLLTDSSFALLEQARLYNDVNTARREADSILNRLNQAQAESVEKQLELEILAARRTRIEEDDNLRWGERRRLLRELNEVYDEATIAQTELATEIEILGNMHYEVYTQMSETTVQFADEQKFAYENLSDAQRAVVDKLVDRWTMYRDLSREMFSEVRTETKLWSETTDENGNIVRESLLEVGDTQENVMQAMIDNMRANREATTEWSSNLDELAYRTSEEFAEHMRSMGIGSAAYVAAMLSDCHDLLYELAAEFEMGGHAATDNIASTLGEGGEELVGLVDELGRNLGTTLSQSIVDADFENIGMMLPEGLTRGIEGGTESCREAVSNMSSAMSEAFKRANDMNSPSRLYKGYGQNIIAGLNQGLLAGEGSVMATATRIANNVAETMRRALQINSPSRVMREGVGRFIPEGVAAGIDKYADAAIGSVEKLAYEMVNIKIPSVDSMINFGPSLSYAGAGGYGGNVTNVDRTNDNRGLFEGATINWHNKEDIRHTMQKIARATQDDSARMF